MAKFRKIDGSKLKMIIIGLVIAIGIGYSQWEKMSPSAKRKIAKTFNINKNFNEQNSRKVARKSNSKSRYKKKSSKKARYAKGPRKKSKQNAARGRPRNSNSIQRASDR